MMTPNLYRDEDGILCAAHGWHGTQGQLFLLQRRQVSKYPRKPNEQMLTPLVTQLMQNQMLQHNG